MLISPGGFDKWLHINLLLLFKEISEFSNLQKEELFPVMCHANSQRHLDFVTAGTQRPL